MQKVEFLNGTILLLLGAWIWWLTQAFPDLPEGYPGPALFPQVISVGFILVGLGLLFGNRALKRTTSIKTSLSKQHVWRLIGGFFLVAIFPFIQHYVSFIFTLGLICLGMALLLRVKPLIAVFTSILTTSLIYLIFSVLLGVSL